MSYKRMDSDWDIYRIVEQNAELRRKNKSLRGENFWLWIAFAAFAAGGLIDLFVGAHK